MRTQSEINDAYTDGRFLKRSFNKNITVNTTLGISQDLSGVSGNPIAQYYLGVSGQSTEMSYLTNDKGLDHGGTMTGYKKYLHRLALKTVTATLAPCTLEIYDYLMYYPFIGMDTGVQSLANTITLPRYPATAGIQMMLVEQNPYIGNVTCQIGYTNQDGVAGRLSPVFTLNTAVSAGTIATSAPRSAGVTGDLIPLQSGDYGVQSADTIEFFTGDVGTVCICLVKPITTAAIYETASPNIVDFWFNNKELPEIKNNAYLNMVIKPSQNSTGAVTNTIFGDMITIWELE